jgi:hypothetical protein
VAACPSGAEFAQKVAEGVLRDQAAPPVTSYHDDVERSWTVEYARDGQRLGIEVDLIGWELKRRWNTEGDLGWPLIESPIARQTDTGHVAVGGAAVFCGNQPAWLFALPGERLFVAGYHGDPAPFALRTPGGSVTLDAMGSGVVTWWNGEVTVDAIHGGAPRIEHAADEVGAETTKESG